jgi:hypothetical protein
MNRMTLLIVLTTLVIGPAVDAEGAEQVFSVFTGVTDDRGDKAFSLGLDYEYKFSEVFGIGGLLDVATGDIRSFVVGVPIFVHPIGGLVLVLAPGVEHQDDGSNEALVRLGAGWEFELSERFVLVPMFNVDFVDSEKVYVYGVEFAYRFGG